MRKPTSAVVSPPGQRLHRWRWWLATITGMSFILLESIEHVAEPGGLDWAYLRALLQFGFILPVLVGLLLSRIARATMSSLPPPGQSERQRLARELHDSLGQNLSYLQLKLDSLAAQASLEPGVAEALAQARAVAAAAYQQLRGTLSQLKTEAATDVAAALFEQARAVSQRAGFSVDFSTAGQPVALPLPTQLALLAIGQEALRNVEQHAHAHQVRLRVLWTPAALAVHLTDDGRGFAPEKVAAARQASLQLMQARAQAIKA